ncbi:MAG: aspartate/glutamate racemase family protein [Paracoccaceae bacterium]|nr:aspartate/glutamate racemase family protein [Paracoccaceae bacterium]
MRIALVNPNTSDETTERMVEIAAKAAGPDVTIAGFTAGFGVPLITEPHALDVSTDAVAVLARVLEGFDAVIVSAFGDPGVQALRDRLEIPVTGIAEAAMAEAGAGGRRFAVVTTTPDLAPRIADTAAGLGHAGFAGTWTTSGDAAALLADPAALQKALRTAIARAVAEAEVIAVVIGGGPLAMAARALAGQSPVPLIEPVPSAVRLTFSRLGLEVCV